MATVRHLVDHRGYSQTPAGPSWLQSDTCWTIVATVRHLLDHRGYSQTPAGPSWLQSDTCWTIVATVRHLLDHRGYSQTPAGPSWLQSDTCWTILATVRHLLDHYGYSEWLKANKLPLNVAKSKCMVFHHPLKKIPTLLKINDSRIECVNKFDFLGLTKNTHLNWKNHLDRTAGKPSREIGVIRKLKHFVPQYVLLTLYNSLMLPHINY